MNRGQALAGARNALEAAGIEEAPLESEVLLRHVLDIGRAELFVALDVELTPGQEESLRCLLERRLHGEPTAYITGHREFYGLDFYVNPSVLIPRPESELLVDKTINLAQRYEMCTIADIGTGSGAIAVSLAVNLPEVSIYATDISESSLEVARQNARRHGVASRIAFLQGDLLEPLPETVDIIVANLPYVSGADLSPKGLLRFEPALALDGGKDGLDLIRVLCKQAGNKLQHEGILLMEVGEGQATKVAGLLRETFSQSKVEVDRDLAGIERVFSLMFDTTAGTVLN